MKKALLGTGVAALALVAVSVAVWRVADDGSRSQAALVTTKDGNVIKSASGAYSLSVGDAGIVLQGPAGSVRLHADGISASTGSATVELSGKSVDVTADGPLGIRAGTQVGVAAGTSVLVSSSGALELRSSGATTIDAGAALNASAGGALSAVGSGGASIRGSILRLNCASGGVPVARRGDFVVVGPEGSQAPIQVGSPTVLSC